MAPSVLFTSCCSGWIAKKSRNAGINQAAENKRNSPPRRHRSGVNNPTNTPVARFRLRHIFMRKRQSEEYENPGLPLSELPAESSLDSCCREDLEEIQLRAPANSQASLEKTTNVRDTQESLNPLTRFRKFFLREKTPEELELEKLRKEKKSIIKFLKDKNLYNRGMTFDQMEDLKDIAERSFSEKQKLQDVQEIEMKEIKSPLEAVSSESSLKIIGIGKSESAIKFKPVPVELLQSVATQEQTVGKQIITSTERTLNSVPIINIGGECAQFKEELLTDQDNICDKLTISDGNDGVQRSINNGENLLPAHENFKSCEMKDLQNIPEDEQNKKMLPIQHERGRPKCITDKPFQITEDMDLPTPSKPFIDRIKKSEVKYVENQGSSPATPENEKFCDSERMQKNSHSKEPKEGMEESPSENENHCYPKDTEELPLPEVYLPWLPKADEEEFPPPPTPLDATFLNENESNVYSIPQSPEDYLFFKPKECDPEYFPPLHPENSNLRIHKANDELANSTQSENDLTLVPAEGDQVFLHLPQTTNSRKSKFKEAKSIEIMDSLSEDDKAKENTSIETDKDDAVEQTKHVEELSPPLLDEKINTMAYRIDGEPNEKIPPALPPKLHKSRIVGFKLKSGVNKADGGKTQLDATYNHEEEERKRKSTSESSKHNLQSNLTPACLQGLRWKFDKPYSE